MSGDGRMRRLPGAALAGLLACLAAAGAGAAPSPAPPFPSAAGDHWVGTPVDWDGLRGRVVLLHVWTFGGVNCARTHPWIRDTLKRNAGKGLAAVGIHTPELAAERDAREVAAQVARNGLEDHPHFIDNDYAYWKALGTQAWPTVYLVDRCGRIRARQVGEVHAGEETGDRLESKLKALLAEKPQECGK